MHSGTVGVLGGCPAATTFVTIVGLEVGRRPPLGLLLTCLKVLGYALGISEEETPVHAPEGLWGS